MTDLKIVGWTNYDSSFPNLNFRGKEPSFTDEIVQIIVNEIKKDHLLFAGDTHQGIYSCVPVFSNGTCLRCSMRAWGYIMSLAYNDDSYMNYYMATTMEKEEILPQNEAAIEPNEDEKDNGALAMVIGPDVQAVTESLACGIEFMTFDKAIKENMPYIKMSYERQNSNDDQEDSEELKALDFKQEIGTTDFVNGKGEKFTATKRCSWNYNGKRFISFLHDNNLLVAELIGEDEYSFENDEERKAAWDYLRSLA